MTDFKPTFLMFDLESTGTRMNGQDYVLEIGAIALTDDYQALARYRALVHVPLDLVDEALDNQVKRDGSPCTFVREMHTKNGLLEDLRRDEAVNTLTTRATQPAAAYRAVSESFCDWLRKMEYEPGNVILVGHSIATFDYPFLKATLPLIFRWLSHRTEDFGAVGRYLRRCGANIPELPKDRWPHRALPDCEIELHEAQLCTALTRNAFRLADLLTLSEPLQSAPGSDVFGSIPALRPADQRVLHDLLDDARQTDEGELLDRTP